MANGAAPPVLVIEGNLVMETVVNSDAGVCNTVEVVHPLVELLLLLLLCSDNDHCVSVSQEEGGWKKHKQDRDHRGLCCCASRTLCF